MRSSDFAVCMVVCLRAGVVNAITLSTSLPARASCILWMSGSVVHWLIDVLSTTPKTEVPLLPKQRVKVGCSPSFSIPLEPPWDARLFLLLKENSNLYKGFPIFSHFQI